MRAPDRASLRSPFRSPAVLAATARGVVRRHRLGRLAVLGVGIVLVIVRVDGAFDAAAAARSRWEPTSLAWVTTTEVESGALLEPGVTALVEVPTGLVPDDATTVDPTGVRTRVGLAPGEILRDARLSDATTAPAARTPQDHVTVALDRTNDLFGIGDRADLHDRIDGTRLAADALVVAVTDRDVAVAVDATTVAEVIRGLGRGGVVAVLRAG